MTKRATARLKVATDDPVATICKVLCQSKVFETGQGTCALICMDQLGNPRKRGCYHASRVHDRIALAILEALSEGMTNDVSSPKDRADG